MEERGKADPEERRGWMWTDNTIDLRDFHSIRTNKSSEAGRGVFQRQFEFIHTKMSIIYLN